MPASPKTLPGRLVVERFRVERVVNGKWALWPNARGLTLAAARTYWLIARLQKYAARVVSDDERAVVRIKPDGEEV